MNIMNQVFSDFEENSIKYVHFKSNMHLNQSFLGKADFDVLIDKYKHYQVMNILIDHGGKLFRGPIEKYYPGVEDWLLFDDETGIIYHLHLHCQLASGKAFLKDYVIPWTEECFNTRKKDEEYNIYTTSSEMELMLLIVRCVIKSNLKDNIKARLHRFDLNKELNEERIDLLKKINYVELQRLVKRLIPKQDQKIFLNILKSKNISSRDFQALSVIVRKIFRIYRYYSPLVANIKSWINYNMFRVKRHLNGDNENIITKKVDISGGLIIAFIGIDGSGKSTTTKEIVNWLSNQIECKRFYMGEGEATSNIGVVLFKKLVNLNKNLRNRKTINTGSNADSGNNSISKSKRLKQMIAAYTLLSIEKSNNKKIRLMNRYRQRGGICILDRYPQIEVEGCNDGPKMGNYEKYLGSDSLLLSKLKEKEMDELNIVKEVKPDIIFRLNITTDTSMERKPEQKEKGVFEEKLKLLNNISYQNANIIDIDAEQPYETELLMIKQIIWEYL